MFWLVILMMICALLILVIGCGWMSKGPYYKVRLSRLRNTMILWLIVFGGACVLGFDDYFDNISIILLVLANMLLAVPILLAMIVVKHERRK